MEEIRYLSLADVLALHQAMMEKFGVGPAHLREEGLLESAIMRPRMAAYYDEVDIIRQAALLAVGVGVSPAQAFLDGNKRISFAVTDTFLRVNGHFLEVEPFAAHEAGHARILAIAIQQFAALHGFVSVVCTRTLRQRVETSHGMK